jgi:hypothetical protein
MAPVPVLSAETLPKSTGRKPYDTGATEDQMTMAGTLPQRTDRIGTKIEDLAGTGEIDSSGG